MAIRLLDNAYTYLFYRLGGWAKNFSEDGFHEWKAHLVICVLEVYLLLEMLMVATIVARRPVLVDNPYAYAVPLGIGLAVANYFVFIHGGRWKRYETEFESYSSRTKFFGNMAILLLILLTLGSLIVTFYAMSQVDWLHR